MVWRLLEHLFPCWSLGTNMLPLQEEKKVIRQEEQTQTRIKANFSNLILRQCKSLRFDQKHLQFNSIYNRSQVGTLLIYIFNPFRGQHVSNPILQLSYPSSSCQPKSAV